MINYYVRFLDPPIPCFKSKVSQLIRNSIYFLFTIHVLTLHSSYFRFCAWWKVPAKGFRICQCIFYLEFCIVSKRLAKNLTIHIRKKLFINAKFYFKIFPKESIMMSVKVANIFRISACPQFCRNILFSAISEFGMNVLTESDTFFIVEEMNHCTQS